MEQLPPPLSLSLSSLSRDSSTSEDEIAKMQGDGSGSSMRRQNSGRKLCFCRLDAEIRQAWTDKNPGRRFYGCPRYKVS